MTRNRNIWPGWMGIFINKNAAWEATSACSDSGDRHSLLGFHWMRSTETQSMYPLG